MKNVITIIKEVLQKPNANVQYMGIAGGMTNKNYIVDIDGERMVFRMPGNGTASLIDRRKEYENLQLGSKLGINPELYYFNMENGMKLTREVPNSTTLAKRSTFDQETLQKVAKIFQILHRSDDKMPHAFRLFDLMEEYEQLAIAANATFYAGFDEVKAHIKMLQERFNEMLIEQTPCHIDPTGSNFLMDDKGKVYLIDWEYGGMFDPLWDLAAFSLELDLSANEEADFFQYYFGKMMTEEERERILIHKIFQDFLWSIWTLFKEEKGDQFGLYGRHRFERAKNYVQLHETLYNREHTAQ